jgi:hypothetical protein
MARIKLLGVRFSAAEFLLVAAAAEAAGLHPVAWLRRHAIQAAATKPDPAPSSSPPPPAGAAKLGRTVATRLTAEQYAVLEERAEACGLPIAALIRKVVLGLKPVPRRPLVRSAIVAVNRVGNNLNQLVHLAHTSIVLAPDLLRTLSEVHDQFQALQDALLAADSDDVRETGELQE